MPGLVAGHTRDNLPSLCGTWDKHLVHEFSLSCNRGWSASARRNRVPVRLNFHWRRCSHQATIGSLNRTENETNGIDVELPRSSHRENGRPPSIASEMSSSAPEPESALTHLLTSKNLIVFISRVTHWADSQKESGLAERQQRGFYSHEDWRRHRSSTRHIRHIKSSLSSRVILSLIPPVFTITAISVLIASYNTAVDSSLFPSFLPLLHASSLPYELIAPALALLLVFRTEASYSRYDEGRKTWTEVISGTKDFAMRASQLIRNPKDVVLKSHLLAYIMAFPVALKCHLIYESDVRNDLQSLLGDDDLEFVLSSRHRPNCMIQLMSQTLNLLQLEVSERTLMDGNISEFNACISVCERLVRTPIPLSYTRLTSRFLVLWHLTLPFILWDSCKWLAVPATFFSSATLFCIEEVGVLIEEPFTILSLDKIIGAAHEHIWELLDLQQRANEYLSQKSPGGDSASSKVLGQ